MTEVLRPTPPVFSDGRFENLSGKFCPESSSFGEEIDRLGLKRPEETFWAPEVETLAVGIVGAFCSELAVYGVPQVEFDKNQVLLLGKTGAKKNSGQHQLISGFISISRKIRTSLDEFAVTFGHEVAHHLEARILYIGYVRRGGLLLVLTNNHLQTVRGDDSKIRRFLDRFVVGPLYRRRGPRAFSKIHEAVAEKTTRRIMAKHFPQIDQEDGNRNHPYNWYIELVDLICSHITETNPGVDKDSADVYRLFEQASFGHGRILPLARAIEMAYGRGSFAKILFAIEALPDLKFVEAPLKGRDGQAEEMLRKYDQVKAVLRAERSLE